MSMKNIQIISFFCHCVNITVTASSFAGLPKYIIIASFIRLLKAGLTIVWSFPGFLPGIMASANFSQFVVIAHSFEYVYLMRLRDLPQVRAKSFLSSTYHIYVHCFRVGMDFNPFGGRIHTSRLVRFLFAMPRVCLQLPSDSTSRWTPLLFSYAFPATGYVRNFHPIDFTHAERTTKTPTAFQIHAGRLLAFFKRKE